jgi:hypothetical protein
MLFSTRPVPILCFSVSFCKFRAYILIHRNTGVCVCIAGELCMMEPGQSWAEHMYDVPSHLPSLPVDKATQEMYVCRVLVCDNTCTCMYSAAHPAHPGRHLIIPSSIIPSSHPRWPPAHESTSHGTAELQMPHVSVSVVGSGCGQRDMAAERQLILGREKRLDGRVEAPRDFQIQPATYLHCSPILSPHHRWKGLDLTGLDSTGRPHDVLTIEPAWLDLLRPRRNRIMAWRREGEGDEEGEGIAVMRFQE